jgi:hypothetical protein
MSDKTNNGRAHCATGFAMIAVTGDPLRNNAYVFAQWIPGLSNRQEDPAAQELELLSP